MDDRLHKFIRLVEIGNFTRAAEDLHISQPALTLAIGKLERELRTPLLIRGNRKLDLTEAGKIVYEAALEHQTITDNLQTSLIRLARKRPSVTIGMTDSIAAMLCAAPIFEKLEQAADVTIVVNNSRYLRDAIASRNIDLAFVIDDGTIRPAITSRSVGTDTLLLVTRPEKAHDVQRALNTGRITQFISYDKPSTTYQHIHRDLGKLGITVRPSLYSTSPDVMLSMVLRGKGVAALPEHMVAELLKQKRLTKLTQGHKQLSIKRPLASIRLEGKTLPDCLMLFLKNVFIS